jgi:hypothetical protein
MRLEIRRNNIVIIPDGTVDEAYLEEVLKLRQEGDAVVFERVNASGLNCWAYLRSKGTAEDYMTDLKGIPPKR